MTIKRALVSVYDKSKINILVDFFIKNKVEVLSTGGTAKHLKSLNSEIKLVEISKYTKFNEILNGRVKTLHPKIHSGILADKNNKKHLEDMELLKLGFIDLVVVNLYPFEKISTNSRNSDEKCIENIDIGGPTMIRAAAKNYKNVLTLSSPDQYDLFINEIRNNGFISKATRKTLAALAFENTAYYESLISNWFNKNNTEICKKNSAIPLKKIKDLRYGENPHQSGAYYKYGNNKLSQINGKNLSFNNIYDLEAAVELSYEFEKGSCVIVKHGNPCGVALDNLQHKAYKKALISDKTSAFGGVVAFNQEVNEKTATQIAKIFTEIVIAPDFSSKAKNLLSKRKNLILIKYKKSKSQKKFHIKSTSNFILVQEKDQKIISTPDLQPQTNKKPSKKDMDDMIFAFTVAKHVNSNAIVLASNLCTLGIGVGQTSRIDSTIQAISKMKKNFKKSRPVMASDGFFPFPDIIELCSANNIKGIIQPGGSLNDKIVIESANKHHIPVVFTNIRHFRH